MRDVLDSERIERRPNELARALLAAARLVRERQGVDIGVGQRLEDLIDKHLCIVASFRLYT